MGILGWLAIAAAGALLVFAAGEITCRRAASKLRPLTEWRNWEMHHKVAALNDLAAEGGASVVAVGSSMVNAAVDPELLSQLMERDRPAFNGALNGAGMRLLELWTMDIILPRLRPDVVVIGLGSGELNSNSVVARRLLDELLTSPAWRDLTEKGPPLDRLIRYAEKRSFLVRYRRYLGRRALLQPDPYQRATACRRLGMLRWFLIFRFRAYKIEDRQLEIWKDVLNQYEIGGEQIASLRRLIDGLRAAGVIPLVVKMPCTDDMLDLHPGGQDDFRRFESVLDPVSRESGAAYADLKSPFSSLEDFADPVHVNGKGQTRFTNLLANFIAEVLASTRAPYTRQVP